MFFWIILGIILCQRAFEIWLSIDHSQWMQRHGGTEYGREHYRWMILLHAGFLSSLVLEYCLRPRQLLLICLIPLLSAQVLRYSAMWALGKFWNTRVWVLTSTAPVSRGIFRLMPHPNYLGVALEIFFLPAMFGLWITAVAFSLLNTWMMAVRVRVEEQALRMANEE
ncbi:MAG TPA: isoprenylcysteine carboxylmethyltransferase family protein [Acidobacteriota bacterium]|jgi:methyltransferase